jgi:hypothetical protein
MANQTSVRSAYANLVSALAKSFPNNCAHLKKLPKTQNLIADWQVLVDNPRVSQRDISLFHEPPLSALGLSRLQKEGKLSAKSTTNIWGYIEQVLQALQPPANALQLFQSRAEGQGQSDLRLEELLAGLQAGAGQGAGLEQLLGGLQAGAGQGGEVALGRLLQGAGLEQLLGGLQGAAAQGGDVDLGRLLQGLGQGGGLPDGIEAPVGLGHIFSKLAGNPAFANILDKVKAQVSANPALAQMAEELRAGGPASFLALAQKFKGNMEAMAQAGDGPLSMTDVIKSLLGGNAPAGEQVEQNVKEMMDKLPPEFKSKLNAFGEQVQEKEGDSFANMLGLLGTHFDQHELTNAAELILPNIAQLIPNQAQAAAAH